MKHGKQLPVWLEKAAAGHDVPAAVADVPPIPAGCALAWQAFSDLSSDRQIGMAAGPIPWSSVDAWAKRNGIDEPEEFDELWLLIRAADSVVMEHIAAQSAARKNDKPRLTGDVPKR